MSAGAPGIDPLSEPDSEPDDDDLPLVSNVREVELPAATVPGRKQDHRAPDNDPEASFVKAMRAPAQRARGDVAEVTAVREAPRRAPRVGARLVVLEGPDEGGALDLALVPSLVGRSTTAEIGLTDPTVSLCHLELRRAGSGEGYVLCDLSSSSGTLVNGVLAEGEVGLRHGDVIALGKTTLRFLRGDVAPAARTAPGPSGTAAKPLEPTEQIEKSKLSSRTMQRTRSAVKRQEADQRSEDLLRQRTIVRARIRHTTKLVIGACAAILVVAVLIKGVHGYLLSDESPAQIRAQVAELLADGRNRLRAQDIDGAGAAALTVLALDGDNDEAVSLQRMATTETEARDAVALALRLGDDERDVEAGQILQRVADASVFAPTRDRLQRTLQERGEVRSRRAIEVLLDQGRLAEAAKAAEQHILGYASDDEGPPLLLRVREAQANAPRSPGLGEARAAFASGDLAKARSLAHSAGLQGYLRDLDRFEAAFTKGRGALLRFEGDAADSLHDAFMLLSPLGATASSPIFADVRQPYGKALFIAGAAKLESGTAQRCDGARALYRASRVLGDDAAVEQKLRDLQALALAGLEKARAARAQDVERSSAIAREHVCLARPGTKTYEDLRGLSRL